LKKPNRVSIRQFFVRVEQLNSYLETLPCLFNSPKANQATKKVLPLDDADLPIHPLRMCLAKWQTQYDLAENSTPVSTRALLLVLENIENNVELDTMPASMTKAKGAEQKRKMESEDSRIPKKPKKVGWTEKHCVLCKKHGGMHKMHNTHDCRRYNKDGTPIKKNGSANKNPSKERKLEGVNFAQILSPFTFAVNDSVLVSNNTSIRNVIFFNRSSTVYGLDYSYQYSVNKTLLTSGFEIRKFILNTIVRQALVGSRDQSLSFNKICSR
jgi:hypothetical protein